MIDIFLGDLAEKLFFFYIQNKILRFAYWELEKNYFRINEKVIKLSRLFGDIVQYELKLYIYIASTNSNDTNILYIKHL